MEVQWITRTAIVVVVLLFTTTQYVTSVAVRMPRASTISWQECEDTDLQDLGVSCAFISVPLDYDNPQGENITLALTGIGADPNAGAYQGTIIVKEGDAGSTGLFDIDNYQYISNNAGATYQWIAFDPRGRGDSTPNLRCSDDYFDGPRMDYVPSRKAISDYWTNKSRSFARNCRNIYGSRLQYYTALDTVKDVESIRVALDEAQVHLYGFGYGTYIFELYATLYAANVGRMILDSSVDPRRLGFAYILDQSYRFDNNMKKWFNWIAQYPSSFASGGTDCQVARNWDYFIKYIAANPQDDIGAAVWTEMFIEAAYNQDSWVDLGWGFADYVNAGTTDTLVDWGSLSNNYYAVEMATICTDARWPSVSTATAVTWRAFTQAPLFGWFNGWLYKPCEYWPVRRSTPVEVDGSGVGSILLISETLDPYNPYEGSLEVRRRFPGARLVAVEDGISNAHSLYGNDCVDDPIAAYLADGTLPSRESGDVADVVCQPLPDPDPTSRSNGQGKGKGAVAARRNKSKRDGK